MEVFSTTWICFAVLGRAQGISVMIVKVGVSHGNYSINQFRNLMENKRFIQYIAQCDSWSTCGSKPISMLFLTESDYTPRTRRIPPPKSKMKVLMMWHLEMRICAVMELSDIGPQELLVGVVFCFLLSFRI